MSILRLATLLSSHYSTQHHQELIYTRDLGITTKYLNLFFGQVGLSGQNRNVCWMNGLVPVEMGIQLTFLLLVFCIYFWQLNIVSSVGNCV